MATSVKRVCWDACAWIAVIQGEKIQNEDRFSMGREVLEAAARGQVEIVTSTLNLAEVCKTKCAPEKVQDNRGLGEPQLAAFFERDDILLLSVDKYVGVTARRLMMSDLPGLKPADAVHVATALVAGAAELHTFDSRLLSLNGQIQRLDGTPLTIRKPQIDKAAAPLLEILERQEPRGAVDLSADDLLGVHLADHVPDDSNQ